MEKAPSQKPKTLQIFAPAKINLYLHVTGRSPDNYHTLDSIVCFTDIGDKIQIEESTNFKFETDGPFAAQLSDADRKSKTDSTNLVVRGARSLAQIANKELKLKITLTKNLPIASGLGGGSSNAAATIWALQDWWNLPRNTSYLPPLLKSLGADVPACMSCEPVRMRGIGDILDPVSITAEIPIILINPLKPCLTQNVFLNFNGPYKKNLTDIPNLENENRLIAFLKKQDNDLLKAALTQVPEIENCLAALQLRKGCTFARMSGSGGTCFGFFENIEAAESACQSLTSENPDWWIKSGWINRTQRY